MPVAAIMKGQACSVLCDVLEKNDIRYEMTDNYCISCTVTASDRDINMIFHINPSKMLVTLYSPVIKPVPSDTAEYLSLALCAINHSLFDGAFCIDLSAEMVYFKMTASYYNSDPEDFIFEYMLSAAADVMDEYSPKIEKMII